MNGKLAKKVRKTLNVNFRDTMIALSKEPLRARLGFALKIIFKREIKFRTSVAAGHRPDGKEK